MSTNAHSDSPIPTMKSAVSRTVPYSICSQPK